MSACFTRLCDAKEITRQCKAARKAGAKVCRDASSGFAVAKMPDGRLVFAAFLNGATWAIRYSREFYKEPDPTPAPTVRVVAG